ncbi:MAG TPA: STAS-like domain-containing protein [Rhizomicrobium sp.]|jgi:hypothetical protein|nr:STAS-like domain-containing protein [Rhizomicrobium sp.]
MPKKIVIDRDFSHCPGGRYRAHGEKSGEEFRDEFLAPSLKQNDRVEVVLDGTEGYASSFLEEAFGGLVRVVGFAKSELGRRLSIRAEDPAFAIYKRLAERYIEEATPSAA